MISRRGFVRAAATTCAGALGLGFYTWRIEPEWLEVVRRDLPVDGLAPELEGRTLLQISDLHIGPRVDDGYIAHTLEVARTLTPDFVVMTGDWITYRTPRVFEQLARLLEGMPHGALGTVGILGNHDYGFGWRMAEVGDRVAHIAGEAGVGILRNEAVRLAGLQIIGLEDLWGPHFDARWNLEERVKGAATIALCHNPDGADQPFWGGFRGWILAGHTHGGQCKPPFLPPPVIPVENKRYTSGEIRVDERKVLYINRGIGYMIRVRFNARPELTLFRLRRTSPGVAAEASAAERLTREGP